jgi:hemerythrin-like metal-binding protein
MLWDETLETGVREIDVQNFDLLERIELLGNAGNGEVGKELKFLEEKVLEYFKKEQQLHEEFGYADAEAHRFNHKSYIVRLQRLIKKYNENGPTLENMIIFERDAVRQLKKHIATYDRNFAPVYFEDGRNMPEKSMAS